VHDREDRCVCADPECERDERDGCKARVAGELTQREMDVLTELIAQLGAMFLDHPASVGAMHVSPRVLRCRRTATRLSDGVVGRDARVDELLGLHVEMEAQLIVHFALHARPRDPRAGETLGEDRECVA
jgi:hypothetical protein